MNSYFKHIARYPIAYGICLVLLSLLPMLLLGENAYILIHDNLDSEFLYRILTSKKDVIFNNSASIEQVMNGLPRTALLSGFNIIAWLFYFFPPLYAYLINEIIIHIIAFIGIFLLLKTYFLKEMTTQTTLIILGVSLCFSFIPFYSIHGLTVPGQPFLLYAFLNLLYHNRSSWTNWLIIIIFPFYSTITLSFLFISTILLILGVYFYVFRKIKSIQFLVGFILFSSLYIFVEHGMIWSVFNINNLGFVSHRAEAVPISIVENLIFYRYFLHETQYHSGFMYIFIIIITLLISFSIKKKLQKTESFLLGAIFLVIGLSFLSDIIRSLNTEITIVKMFNFARFYFLLPIIWMLLFSISLYNIAINIKTKKHVFFQGRANIFLLSSLLFSQAIIILYYNKQFKKNISIIMGKEISEPTYKQFFATDIFAETDKYIARPKDSYRIMCIGIHPSVAQYNGFYTLDSYQNNYKLSYKHKFRRIIEKELEKDPLILHHFDDGGSRCYAIVSGRLSEAYWSLGEDVDNGKYKSVDFNWSVFKEMGGEYIFSKKRILFQDDKLDFEGEFTNRNSVYTIYLYHVK